MTGKIVTVTIVSASLSMLITAAFIYFADAMDIMVLGLSIAVTCSILVSPIVTYAFQLQTIELNAAHMEMSELQSRLHDAYCELEHYSAAHPIGCAKVAVSL